MASAEELDFFDNDAFHEEPTIDEEGDEENPSDAQVLKKLFDGEDDKEEVVKKRRVVQPRLKLNEATLMGPKGIAALRESFKGYKVDTKADPYANLGKIMKKYEYWAHVMYPKLKFDDVLQRCENLGDKRPIKVYMMKSRLGMPLTDEDFVHTKRQDSIIVTEHNEEEKEENRNRRSESDEDGNYDPFEISEKQKDEPSTANTQMPDETLDDTKENSNTLPTFMEEPHEWENEPTETDEQQLAREADEIMADFDF